MTLKRLEQFKRFELRRQEKANVIAWNLFGLIDLIFAITMGVLYSEGSFGVLRTGVSTRLMTTFPVNMIPTFFVPLFKHLGFPSGIRSSRYTRP